MEIPQGAKQPQDFKRPAPSDEDFHFEHDGKDYVIPPASAVKMGVAKSWRHLNESDQILALLEYICDDETMAAIDDMTGKQFAAMHARWQRHQLELAKATQGES